MPKQKEGIRNRNKIKEGQEEVKASTITREQLLKEAPRLIEIAIARGWMSYPKKPKQPDQWHTAKDLSDEDIQELRKTFYQSSGD